MPKEQFYLFLPEDVTFISREAAEIKTIYAPLCGNSASGLKSAITPALSGDIKIDKWPSLSGNAKIGFWELVFKF